MANVRKTYLVIICLLFSLFVQAQNQTKKMEKATFGGGCFWCVEAIFQELEGVSTVISGYAGGHTENPRYVEVCKGYTGHAEVVQITFDPSVITFKELLEVFFKTHDPTSLNRQGADTGTQYRSIVLYHSEEQKKQTEEYIDQLDNSGTYRKLIVTEVSPLKIFYEAEAGHQDYFANNKGKQPYCSFVIQPKLTKFQKAFSEKLKKK